MTNADVKEHIIEVTTALLEEYDGDERRMTSRVIAERAGVSLGLINYHFGNKDALITVCVQRIIGSIISGFTPETEFSSSRQRLTAEAKRIFDFLLKHPALSKISILGDHSSFSADCNTARSMSACQMALQPLVADGSAPLAGFILVSVMQAAFLERSASSELLGYDLNDASQRAAFIEDTVNLILDGGRPLK